jgi:hypothetical protein
MEQSGFDKTPAGHHDVKPDYSRISGAKPRQPALSPGKPALQAAELAFLWERCLPVILI